MAGKLTDFPSAAPSAGGPEEHSVGWRLESEPRDAPVSPGSCATTGFLRRAGSWALAEPSCALVLEPEPFLGAGAGWGYGHFPQ